MLLALSSKRRQILTGTRRRSSEIPIRKSHDSFWVFEKKDFANLEFQQQPNTITYCGHFVTIFFHKTNHFHFSPTTLTTKKKKPVIVNSFNGNERPVRSNKHLTSICDSIIIEQTIRRARAFLSYIYRVST